ncbi:MAG: N-methyl-L-tryptophan oxidase [Pseudonocardiaceae bacterium]|nr:N-methyl-L-tryptophan oxidase [Pseudonocardiaceae bacterium]
MPDIRLGRPGQHFDVIVLGVGGMGSATVYQLARRGKRVLGLERFDIPNTMGSSHGETRIIRLPYYEDPTYVMLVQRAYELWRSLESRAGEQLLHVTGSIDAGPADSWVFTGALRSAVEYDLPHEVLSGAELGERFPGYRLPRETMALYQPDGGFLRPERCIVAHVEAAIAHGAQVHGRERVHDWQPTADGVRVITDKDVYTAERLVVTAGAWNREVLPFLSSLAVPERQVVAWLQPRRPELFTPSRFPVFNALVEEGRFYGFPVYGVPGFKFGKYHHLGEHGDPETLDPAPGAGDEDVLGRFAARYFPDGFGPTMALQTCMFTNSPDHHFLIDLHPVYPQVSFASPCSGHGYKFASVVGEIMADLAVRGTTRHNISLFSLQRFGIPDRRAAGVAAAPPPRRALGTGAAAELLAGHRRQQASSTVAGDDAAAIRPFW